MPQPERKYINPIIFEQKQAGYHYYQSVNPMMRYPPGVMYPKIDIIISDSSCQISDKPRYEKNYYAGC